MNHPLQTKKILCIDADRGQIELVGDLLSKSYGNEVLEMHEALSGQEALDQIEEISPDIVLSDINMPDMDGFEVCQKIRESSLRPAIILMSAYDAESDNATRASEAGADAFLSKPIKKGELLFVVNFVMRTAQLNNALHDKNAQLEESLGRVKSFHEKLETLNGELRRDKGHLDSNLKEMMELNSRLEDKNSQITSMMQEVESRFDSTVGLLASIIELRQAHHQGHSERVAAISQFIGGKLGLSDHQLQDVKVAARLHELGIISLPAVKQEQALDEERGRTQTSHPLVGEMLLKSFPGFEMVAGVIRHLHENVDGSGLPDGLHGDRIPIGSRVISVASFFDHERITHPDKSLNQILDHMREKAGVWFDDQVLSYLQDFVDSEDQFFQESVADCSVFGLKVGMELASDIYSESGINLLRKGVVVNQDVLAKILKFHNVDPIVGPLKIKQG